MIEDIERFEVQIDLDVFPNRKQLAEPSVCAEDLVDIGKRKAQKLVRQGYEIGEDYLDESRRYIKHNPWQSIGIALGFGVALGFIAGLLSRRR